VEGPRYFLGREVTGHGGGAQKCVSQRSRPFIVPSDRGAHQSTQRRSPLCRVYPLTPRLPSFTAPTRLPLTSNTHARTSHQPTYLCTSHVVHARGLTRPGHHDCPRRCSLCAQAVASGLFTATLATLWAKPSASYSHGLLLSRAARSARSTSTSATWPRLR